MENANISFAGCGFLGIYHIGVASCIKEYAPHLLLNKISGASIGAIAGACLLTGVPLGAFTSDMLQLIYEIRQRTLGPFNPLVHVQNMLREMIYNRMPKNAYQTVNGRLFISLTKVADGSNVILSEFKSEEEFVNALLASAFVPFFSGFIPPKVGQYRYMDGGFSNNLPILNENTITVSPFCGESDICPRDSTVQLFHINLCNTSVEVSTPNIYRFARILFPPSPEVLSKMCRQGFDDALKFLQRNNMISCTKCLTVQHTITFPVARRHTNSIEQSETYDPECEECIHHINKAVSSDLPEAVLTNLEHAIERRNKELASWVFALRNTKVISLMTLPYVLAFDAIQAIMKKFAEIAPQLFENAKEFTKDLVEIIIRTLHKMNKTGLFLASKAFGPLSISINMDEPDRGHTIEPRTRSKSKINLELNFDPNKNEKLDSSMFEDRSETLIVHPLEPSGVLDDTYDHLLNVIHQHDAVMAFYYMDEKNKLPQMNLVEFIDITNDNKILGKIDESDVKILASVVDKSEDAGIEDYSTHRNVAASYAQRDMCDDMAVSICSGSYAGSDAGSDTSNIPSDPESDWSQPKKMSFVESSKPESDREITY